MILPVPNKVSKVIDITKYPDFFEKLNKACTQLTRGSYSSKGGFYMSTNSTFKDVVVIDILLYQILKIFKMYRIIYLI